MPVGNFALGFSSALSDSIQQERDRQRQLEDNEIQQHMDLIKALTDRPDANPNLLGKALHDLADLQAAKGGKGKSKKGMQGFMGAHELPLSQLLQGVQSGTTPIMGNTTEDVPVGSQGQAGMAGIGPKPMDLGFGTAGQDMPAPPPQLPSMRTERRPVANQPLLRSPEEMAQQEGMTAGAKAEGTITGQMNARLNALSRLPEGTLSPRDRTDWVRKNVLGLSTGSPNAQLHKFRTSNGQEFTLSYHPDTDTYTDMGGAPYTPPSDAQLISIAPQNQINYFQNDQGAVSGIATDRYSGATTGIQPPPGVQGRSSPAGPMVIDPNSHQVLRGDRTGTVAHPMTIGAPTGGQIPPAPISSTVGAPGAAPGQITPQSGPQPGRPLLKYNAQEQSVVDSIQQAQPMIQRVMTAMDAAGPAGESNSIMAKGHAFGQRLEYAAGFDPSDPTYKELIPLVSFLRVFLAQPYMRGMRNMIYVNQIQEHMPNLGLNPDTPALIRQKLSIIQDNLHGILSDLGTTEKQPAEAAQPAAGGSKYVKRRVQ